MTDDILRFRSATIEDLERDWSDPKWWDGIIDADTQPATPHEPFDLPLPTDLGLGSEVEMARLIAHYANLKYGQMVYADGEFWVFISTQWRSIPDPVMRRLAHRFDGATVGKATLKLKSSHVSGIIKEAGAVMSRPEFFAEPALGLNAFNGTITIDQDGNLSIHEHDPSDRHRFTIAAKVSLSRVGLPPKGSLLHRLLHGSFKDDADIDQKIDLVGEILGAAAYGMATRLPQPKAFIYLGETAQNGKSQLAALTEKLLPRGSVSHIPLSAFGDERRIVNLAGKAANVVEELAGTAIAGETFKAAVTGNPIEARDLYKPAFTFTPRAIHIATTNVLPTFTGGIDRGLQRRLVILQFNRVIPDGEIVADIADRIGREEMAHLMAFALAGAQRLVRNRAYTMPASSIEALNEWLLKDPVNAWVDSRMEFRDNGWLQTRHLYADFKEWCINEDIREKYVPSRESFSLRLLRHKGISKRRTSIGAEVRGIAYKIRV